MRLRLSYGIDPTGAGFYWPDNPKARERFERAKAELPPALFEAWYQCQPMAAEEAEEVARLFH